MSNKIIAVTKVSEKGTIHIPKEIMIRLKLKNGDKIIWILEDDRIYIKKA